MPSLDHEALVQLFRNRPALVSELLRDVVGVAVPSGSPAVVEADLGQITPTEYRADLVVALGNEWRAIVEVQLSRDPEKHWSWPLYVAALRARERCPVLLLVVTTRPDVARWAARPIETGHPGYSLEPLVVGPASIPRITDLDEARADPELAVLSALAHGGDEEGREVAAAALVAAGDLAADRAVFYSDLVLASLGDAARKALEALMSTGQYEPRSDFLRKIIEDGRAEGRAAGRAEGRAEGEAQGRAEGLAGAVLTVLEERGLRLSEADRQRIVTCTELAALHRWISRSVHVATVAELFE